MKFITNLLENLGLSKESDKLTDEEENVYKEHLAKVYSLLQSESKDTLINTCRSPLTINLESSVPLVTKYPKLTYRIWNDLCENFGREQFAQEIHTARIDTFPDGRYYLELCATTYTLQLPGYHLGYMGDKPIETLHILSDVGFSKEKLTEIFYSNISKIELTKEN